MSEQEKGRVLIVEDNERWGGDLKDLVESLGWTVAAWVKTLDEALNIVPQLHELQVNYAFVDGKLNFDETDGSRVALAIHKQAPDVKVVGFSSMFPQPVVDIQMSKAGMRKEVSRILAGEKQN